MAVYVASELNSKVTLLGFYLSTVTKTNTPDILFSALRQMLIRIILTVNVIGRTVMTVIGKIQSLYQSAKIRQNYRRFYVELSYCRYCGPFLLDFGPLTRFAQ